jgi:hypothetical protein
MHIIYTDRTGGGGIRSFNYVSVEADETLDVSCKWQMMTILCSARGNGIVSESFVQYSDEKVSAALEG